MPDSPSPSSPLPGHRFATFDERLAVGVERRKTLPRRDQGRWSPAASRPDAIQALLAANAGRLPELLPIKWGRMALSPFGFFRGAAPLMAADLAGHPTSGLTVQLCGDAHVRNLGAYAAPDGHLVFDLNDFDETVFGGPWEWDVKRLAVSLVLANREAGGKDDDGSAAVRTFAASYRESLARFAAMRARELVAYEVRRQSQSPSIRAILQKAERATPEKTLAKLTAPGPDGLPRFTDHPPLLRHVPEAEAARVLAALASYRGTLGVDRQRTFDAYQPIDVTFKVVGTGSIGTRDYVVLLLGRGPDDPLFIQVKEELPSAYAPYLPAAAACPHQGRRVAEGQRRSQTVSDPFAGWTCVDGADYLVRQLADHKAAVDPAELKDSALREYALICGEALAKAHARTGDAAALTGYCGDGGRLEQALADFAAAYTEQNARDHAALTAAIAAGKLTAVTGI